ncbi:hypothetical protein [Bradyrhizobium sp. 25ACV]
MPPTKRILPFASSAGATPDFAISEADWKALQAALGKELPDDVRGKLIGLTANFLHFASFERAAESFDGTEARLTKVQRSASAFQKALIGTESTDAAFFATYLIERHFDDARIQRVHILSDVLTAFISACTKAQEEVDGDSLAGPRSGAAWNAWIRNVTKLLQENDLPTQVRKDSDKNRSGQASPFVQFVKRLQTSFEPEYRRGKQSCEALAVAIARARRVAKPRKKRVNKTRNRKG